MHLRRASLYPAVLGAVALVLVAAGYVLALTLTEVPLLVLACFGGILIATAAYLSPRLGFYALVASAMFSRYAILVAGVNLRPDQLVLMPVLLGLAPRLLAEGFRMLPQPNRPLRVPMLSAVAFGGLALYIAINLLSSYLFSPEFFESFQIVAWLVLSFLAFAATYFVVGRYVSPREAFFAILTVGFISGAVGTVMFLLFKLTGSMVGIQPPDVATEPIFKATGTFLEANLFGSLQAFVVVGAIVMLNMDEKLRRPASVLLTLGISVSIVALALSLTRAAWLGAISGMLLFVLFRLRSGRTFVLLSRFAMVTVGAVIVLAPTGLLNSVTARFQDIGLNESSGTLAFRLERFRLALAEWPSSPIFGLGTNSYGQRHWDPTTDFAPDYLPNLVLVTLYDTGLLGVLALFSVFVVLTIALIRATVKGRNEGQRALALATLCGAVTLFVSYQATNGLWFSYNWLILAVAVRLCLPGNRA